MSSGWVSCCSTRRACAEENCCGCASGITIPSRAPSSFGLPSFHKARLLPLADDGAAEGEHYLAARRAYRPDLPTPEAPLLWNGGKDLRTYAGTAFLIVFWRRLKAAGIRKPDGRLPRVHDLRHSFAVNALLRWYREGADVQAKLPLLSTYMGHVSIVSTKYYLPFIEPLAVAASERFAERYGATRCSRRCLAPARASKRCSTCGQTTCN
jgi:integrase